jgi:hypothetical protein
MQQQVTPRKVFALVLCRVRETAAVEARLNRSRDAPRSANEEASSSVTDLTESRVISTRRFTDKGTPGVILGRKAKALKNFKFEISNLKFPKDD